MAATEKYDFCYKYLHVHLKFNTLVGMPFFVKTDFKPGSRFSVTLSYLYQFITEFWVFLGLISGIIAMHIVWNDINVLLGCFSSTTHMTQIFSKIILFNWKKNKFLIQLKKLNKIFDDNKFLKIDDKIPDFVNYTSTTYRWIQSAEYIVFICQLFWTTIFFIPFMYKSILSYDSLNDFHSPIVGYFPFNYTVTPRYQLVVIFQIILFYCNNFKTVAIDFFVFGFVVIHILQFRYLNLTLERATQILSNKKRGDEGLELTLNSFLIKWIKQHQDSVCAVRDSIDLVSLFFLIEYGYIVVHTCVPAFVITSLLSWDLNQKVVLIYMCSSALLNLYFLTLSGDVFNDSKSFLQYEEFAVTFYGPHLFEKNKSYQMLHRMLLCISRNKSKVFGFSNVYPLCSVTFGAILRMIMSFYLALNQIKAFKSE